MRRRGQGVSVKLRNTVFIPIANLFSDFSLNVRYNKKCKLFLNLPLLEDLKNNKEVQPFKSVNY